MTKYSVKTAKDFDKAFSKLDKYTALMIGAWINKNLVGCDDPRSHGKALAGKFKGLWRYRIGEYRLICSIEDEELVILALTIGHRRDIYK